MIFARKAFSGYKEITPTDQATETYIVLTTNEHAELRQRIAEAEKQADVAEFKAEHIQKSHDQYVKYHDAELSSKEADIAQLTEEKQVLQEQLATLTAERDAAVQDAEQAHELNENLKRIARQRANSDRGLSPAKHHSGYAILRMDQAIEHYMIKNDYATWKEEHCMSSKDKFVPETHAEAVVWRNFIQTPYDSRMPAHIVGKEILSNLTSGILASWGCTCWQEQDQNGVYQAWTDDNGNPVCGMYKWSLINDLRAGFWTIQIHTTLPLIIPVEGDKHE